MIELSKKIGVHYEKCRFHEMTNGMTYDVSWNLTWRQNQEFHGMNQEILDTGGISTGGLLGIGFKQGILTPISLAIENVGKGFRNGLVEVTWKLGVLFPCLKYQ